MSLDALATLVGCSKSLLSKIETGKIVPTIAMLSRIAAALGTDAGTLLQESTEEKAVFNSAKEPLAHLVPSDKGYRFFPYAVNFGNKVIQPFLFVAERGKVKRHRVTHTGHEWMYMLEGRVNFRVGAETFVMGPNDSLYFDPNLPHGIEPITKKAVYLVVFTHPQENLKAADSSR